jgi:hypothetical protein
MSNPANPMHKLALMGAAGVAAVAVLALGIRYLPSEPMAEIGTTPERVVSAHVVEAVAPDNADASADIAQLRAQAHRASARVGAGSTSTAPSLIALHQQIAKTRVTPTDRARAIAVMEQSHSAEPVDAAWSATSEVAISSASGSQAVREANLQPLSTDSDCRSKTCRISATFADSGQAQFWASTVVTKMGGTLSQARVATRTLPDGRSEVVIFGTRRS